MNGNVSPVAMMRAFNNVTEGFYETDETWNLRLWLEITRARVVIGGQLQNYIDESFYDEFVRQ